MKHKPRDARKAEDLFGYFSAVCEKCSARQHTDLMTGKQTWFYVGINAINMPDDCKEAQRLIAMIKTTEWLD